LTKGLAFPPNVVEFSTTRAQTKVLDDLKVAIHGRGFPQRHITENLLPDYPDAHPGHYNIGLLHTSLAGDSQHDTYAPCTLEELCNFGYDYWALGHIHQPSIRNEHPWVVYSGIPQGRHIREQGERGCYLAKVDSSGNTHVEFRTLDSVRWHLVAVDVTGVETDDSLLDRVDAEIGQLANRESGRLLAIRLQIEGKSSLAPRIERDRSQWQDEFLSIAQRYNNGNVWLESVSIKVVDADRTRKRTDNSDFNAEVMDSLQAGRIESTFARQSWPPDIERALKQLGAAQRQQLETLLPAEASTGTDTEKSPGDAESAPDRDAELQLFSQLRNLVYSTLDSPAQVESPGPEE